MTGYLTVIAEFETTSATYEKFLEICAYDSKHSVEQEPGCHGFTVLTPQDEGDSVVLVETYTDRAAFEAHLKTQHFEKFAAAVKEFGVKERRIRFLTQRAP